jgi:hypothetical protein
MDAETKRKRIASLKASLKAHDDEYYRITGDLVIDGRIIATKDERKRCCSEIIVGMRVALAKLDRRYAV